MTIIGAHVLSSSVGVLWADTETFSEEGKSTGTRTKLVINPMGFGFVYTGWQQVAREAGLVVSDATSYAAALRGLPAVLRRQSEQFVDKAADPSAYARQYGALIGFDTEARCMRGHRFAATDGFCAVLDHSQYAPELRDLAGVYPSDHLSIISAVRRQMDRLREHYPDATGGMLTVAMISRDGVRCGPIYDFVTEAAPAWLIPKPEPEMEQPKPEGAATLRLVQ